MIEIIREREFSTEERKQLAKSGKAMPDGSYPIENAGDLENAIRAWGRGGAKPADKAHIISRARALGASDKIPENWKESDTESANAWEEVFEWVRLEEATKLSMEEVSSRVHKALRDKFGGSDTNQYHPVLVHATYPNSVIFSTDTMPLHRAPFTMENSEAKLGQHVPVTHRYDDIKEKDGANNDGEGKADSDHTGDDAKAYRDPTRGDGGNAKHAKGTEPASAGGGNVASDVTIKESADFNEGIAHFIESTDKSGRVWEILLVEKGTSKNGYHYDPAVLREAAPLFNGVYSYANHTNDDEQRVRPERSIKDKVGRFSDATYGRATLPDGRITEGIKAKFKVVAPWMRDLLRESMDMNEPDFVGFSIDALGKSTPREVGGKKVRWVESIRKVYSVDVVTLPSAGGRPTRLIESDSTIEGGNIMPDTDVVDKVVVPAALTPEQISEIVANTLKEAQAPLLEKLTKQDEEITSLRESARVRRNDASVDLALSNAEGLSAAGKERLRTMLREAASRRDLTDEEVADAIKEAVSYEAAVLQPHLVGRSSGARVGSSAKDNMYHALIGLFEGADQVVDDKSIPRFRSIKEAYCRWEDRDYFDVDPMEIQRAFSTTYDSAVDHKRIQESVNRAQWGQIYADVLYLMLIKAYRANPVYDRWRELCSDIENVPDFQTRHWTRVGGYLDLVTVPEAGTYEPMTSPDDQEVTYAVSKRGGLDDVTFEAIANDRVGAVRRIPTGMARAALRTLFKFVLNLVTTSNPVMGYDTVALYDAAHANTNTVALSLSGLQNMLVAMRSQTAFSETQEILGVRNKPKTLIVPTQLELVAQRLIAPSDAYLAAIAAPSTNTDLDPQAFKGMGLQYIVYDVLSSTTGWYAVADPNEVATLVMGFLNGKEEPELFVQDMPNVGSSFVADKITYKIRHIYGGVVEDHRSFYRGNT